NGGRAAREAHPVGVVERVGPAQALDEGVVEPKRPGLDTRGKRMRRMRTTREGANASPACEKSLRDVTTRVREGAGDDVEFGHDQARLRATHISSAGHFRAQSAVTKS